MVYAALSAQQAPFLQRFILIRCWSDGSFTEVAVCANLDHAKRMARDSVNVRTNEEVHGYVIVDCALKKMASYGGPPKEIVWRDQK